MGLNLQLRRAEPISLQADSPSGHDPQGCRAVRRDTDSSPARVRTHRRGRFFTCVLEYTEIDVQLQPAADVHLIVTEK